MSLENSTSNLLSSALIYAGRGWRVLPLLAGEKRPALARWPELATTDPRQAADWWIDQPDRNVGIATGAGSGFFVLDIDPKNGGHEALALLEEAHGPLPLTYAVRTGSGGTHYYFAVPDFEVTNSPGALKGTGIDIRGEGGQVVAPPSVTALGAYSVQSSAPVADAPAWLLDLIRPKPLALVGGTDVDRIDAGDSERIEQYVERAVEAACANVARAKGGDRNQTLNNEVLGLAGIVAHDPTLVDKSDTLTAMIEACKANGYIRDDGAASVIATFESAWKAGLERPRREWPPVDRHAGLDFGPAATPGMPVVQVTGRKFNELTDEIVGNLAAANGNDPRLFLHGTEVVQIVGPPVTTAALDANLMAYEADLAMHFEKSMPRGGSVVVNAPKPHLETILVLPHKPFPRLSRISLAPYFSPSGRYVSTPGYDAETETFYSPALDMSVLPIPDEPTADQVRGALGFIRREVLHDFPFESESDRTHALALMLLPFVRDIIDGPTPLHDIEAPTPGSGKDKLTEALLMPGVGRQAAVISPPTGEEEWQKALLSHLRHTPQAVVIDNVNTKVTSGSLSMALTGAQFSARLLGASQSVTVPVRAIWVLTGNNPKFSDEVARRTLRIRIDAKMERPELRGGWRHDNITGWCHEHRAELVQACCVIVQGWVRAGMPELVTPHPLGSFESWHSVMGGLLDFVGAPGLLDNREDFLKAGDEEADAWTTLVSLLRRDIIGEWSSKDLAELVTDNGIAIDLGRGDNPALKMGRELSKQRGRWHDGYQFEKRLLNGKTLWRLIGRPNL